MKLNRTILLLVFIISAVVLNLSPARGQQNIRELNPVQKIDVTGSPVKGPAGAPITIVAFKDFQWQYCARLQPILEQVFEQYPNKIKLYIKHFPLDSHRGSKAVHIASVAADKQGKFWPFHDLLHKNYDRLNRLELLRIADQVGLNIEKFLSDLEDKEVAAVVERDLEIGHNLNVDSTPSVFINGRRLVNRSFEGFLARIEEELAILDK